MAKGRRSRWLLAVFATGLSLGLVGAMLHARGGIRSAGPVTVEMVGDGDPAPVWRQQPAFATDPVSGVRPRRSCIVRISLATLGESEPSTRTKHRDRYGFLRRDAIPEPADRPIVLLLGDSHVDGVVDTDANVGTRLERRLTATAAPCYVLNAACGNHGLWQHALRARELVPRLRPAAIVVVVFLGNDLLELDQPLLPHLDDELREQPPAEPTEAAAMLARMQRLALRPQDAQLFWQGLNQAERRRERPEREAVWLAKAAHAIDALEAVAAANDCRVVWALLPSFDLVFPECLRALGGPAAAVADSGAQRQLERALRGLLTQRGITPVDVESAFRRDGELSLYAADYHIDRRGHDVLAECIQPHLRAALAR